VEVHSKVEGAVKEKPDNRDSDDPGIEKLRLLLPYWVKHNEQHILDSEKWLGRAETMGLPDVAGELREAVALMGEANRRIEAANEKMEERDTSGTVVSPVTDPVPGMPEKVAEEAETGEDWGHPNPLRRGCAVSAAGG